MHKWVGVSSRPVMEALQKLLRSPSALSRARESLAYLPDMSSDSLRGFAHLGLLATLLQSFLNLLDTAKASTDD
ncbi:hypothetical protein BH18PSE1_BH18PSE1_00670 [soil metagenome]